MLELKIALMGNPHPVTGRFNKYGSLVAFASKKERDEFCNSWDSRYQCYPIATNRKEAKSLYYAGMTPDQFDEYGNSLDLFTESLGK